MMFLGDDLRDYQELWEREMDRRKKLEELLRRMVEVSNLGVGKLQDEIMELLAQRGPTEQWRIDRGLTDEKGAPIQKPVTWADMQEHARLEPDPQRLTSEWREQNI